MKRSFSKRPAFLVSATALIAVTYGLVRLAYGLVLPDAQADLGFGPSAAGWISAGASTLYCLTAGIGFFTAAAHPRVLVVVAAGASAVGAVGMAVSQDTIVFAVAAVVGSAGAGAASPALVRLVPRNGAGTRAQAIVNSGTGPGLVLAGVLALLVLPEWRVAWSLAAAGAVVAGVAVLWTDRGERDERTDRPAGPGGRWWRGQARLLVAALLLGAGSAAVWNYGRAVLVDAGVGQRSSIVAWVALGVGGATVVLTSRLTDGMRPASLWAASTVAVVAGCVVLAVLPAVMPAVLVACVVFGWGYTAATGALIAWTTEIDAARAASGTSVLFVTLVLGQALGAALTGSLIGAAGSATAFLVAAGLAVAAVPVAGRQRATVATGSGRVGAR